MLEISIAAQQKQVEGSAPRIYANRPPAVIVPGEISAKLRIACGALFRILKWVGIPVEAARQRPAEALEVKIREIADQAVRGKAASETGHRRCVTPNSS